MTENYVVIGDIHGRFDLLVQLLTLIEKSEYKDYQLVFLGDMVDRGPDSFKVVAKVKELCEAGRAVVILGNHEDFMLSFHRGRIFDKGDPWFYGNNGGMKTVESYCHDMGMYGNAHFFLAFEKSGHAEWLKKQPLFIETEKVWFSHAPIPLPGIGQEGERSFRPYWRLGQDFRTCPEALVWTYLGEENEGKSEWHHKKTAICGHVHAIRRNILVPRVYDHIVYADTGSGCAPWGRLTGIILKDGVYMGYIQAAPDVPPPSSIEELYKRLRG